MNQTIKKDTQKNIYEAKLNTIDDDLAEFVFADKDGQQGGIQEELNNAFYWPKKNLPREIEAGDEVFVSLDLKNREEKMRMLKKKKEEEIKQAEMRKMLEDLIN